MKDTQKGFFDIARASAILISCTVGAGILSLPYLFSLVHPFVSTLNLVIAFCIVLCASLFLGDLLHALKEPHQMVGVARAFLTRRKSAILISTYFIYICGAILAYFIGSGQALAEVFPIYSSGVWTTLFFLAGALILFFDLRVFSDTEEILTVFLILAIAVLIGISANKIHIPHIAPLFEQTISLQSFFLPLGGIFFALMGFMSIPDMYNSLSTQHKEKYRASILIGIILCATLYFFFVFATINLTGTQIHDVASISIGKILGKGALAFINIFAALAMFTSFLALAHSMKDSLFLDYRFPKKMAWILAVGIPYVLFLLIKSSFGFIVSITGTVAGIIMILCIFTMYSQYRGYAKISSVAEPMIRRRESSLPHWLTKKGTITALFLLTCAIGLYSLLSLFF